MFKLFLIVDTVFLCLPIKWILSDLAHHEPTCCELLFFFNSNFVQYCWRCVTFFHIWHKYGRSWGIACYVFFFFSKLFYFIFTNCFGPITDSLSTPYFLVLVGIISYLALNEPLWDDMFQCCVRSIRFSIEWNNFIFVPNLRFWGLFLICFCSTLLQYGDHFRQIYLVSGCLC